MYTSQFLCHKRPWRERKIILLTSLQRYVPGGVTRSQFNNIFLKCELLKQGKPCARDEDEYGLQGKHSSGVDQQLLKAAPRLAIRTITTIPTNTLKQYTTKQIEKSCFVERPSKRP